LSPWTEPAWRAEADGWIDEQLAASGAERTGEIDQMHVRAWSTVMRVPTSAGDAYFKANAPSMRFEAALVVLLAGERPDCAPPLLAADPKRGWMLMADAGVRLREVVAEERTLVRWLDILPLYADLQVDLAGHVDELLAMGVPDLRLDRLPSRAEAMIV